MLCFRFLYEYANLSGHCQWDRASTSLLQEIQKKVYGALDNG